MRTCPGSRGSKTSLVPVSVLWSRRGTSLVSGICGRGRLGSGVWVASLVAARVALGPVSCKFGIDNANGCSYHVRMGSGVAVSENRPRSGSELGMELILLVGRVAMLQLEFVPQAAALVLEHVDAA